MRSNLATRFYGVETDSEGVSYVNVPWSSALPISIINSASGSGAITALSPNCRNQISEAVSGQVTLELRATDPLIEYSGSMTELVFVTSASEVPSVSFRAIGSTIGIKWANDTPPEWKTSTFYEFSFIWDTTKSFWYGCYTTYSN